MASIDPGLSAVIDAYRTGEFTTLGKDGTPLTWPTVAVRQAGDDSFLITTTLAFAQKALNVRRDGRVAMLFSDPTGSGLDNPPQVLVRGLATSPEQVLTSPDGLEGYWEKLFSRQPGNRAYLRPPMRWLMDWYFVRLQITVEPIEVTTLPALQPEPVRPEVTSDLVGASVLAQARTSVLGVLDPAGAPVLFRVEALPIPASGGYAVEVPAGIEAIDGPASLLMHVHDEQLAGQDNALVRGKLTTSGDGQRLLVPERVVQPMRMNGPLDLIRLIRKNKQATRGYLERRQLQRDRVRWEQFQRSAAGPGS